MTIKASGRSALILATGFFMCFAMPSQAAVDADTENATANVKSQNATGASIAPRKHLRHSSRHFKRYAHRRSGRVAFKSRTGEDKAAALTEVAGDDPGSLTAMPPSVANANAKLLSTDTPNGDLNALSARANDLLQSATANPANASADNDTLVIAADQLNDVDRSLREDNAPAAPIAVASADPPAAPVIASGDENSTRDQTSLIGKIFIAFGALLTLASAARMFMV
jgi:hypothetical protein